VLWLWTLSACVDGEVTCELRSTVAHYDPACDTWLVLYPEEARIFVDEILVAYLPPDPQPDTVYGGQSGNALTVILDEELANARSSTVTFGPSLEEARLAFSFESGDVSGVVFPQLTEGDPVW